MQKIRDTKRLKSVRESYTLINKSAVLFSILKNIISSNIKETGLNL